MSSRPNVILFLASDLGFGDLGCYGHPTHATPHIDRLASEGIRFTDFHSNGCMCSPSRAALLTGRYQQRVGIEYVLNHHARNLPEMSADAVTYGHAFQRAGYATGFFGKYHTGYMPGNSPLRMGFDEFRGLCGGVDHHSHVTRWGDPDWWHGEELVEEDGYVSDLITDHAIRFVEAHAHAPFFMHVADFLVHFPWQGPDDPPGFQVGHSYDTPEKKYGLRGDRPQVYREMVEAMDRNVGRLVERIQTLGLAERTLFLFATDHGGHHMVARNAPLAGAKGSLLEGGHRIPAIAWWPGTVAAGQTNGETAMLMDLFPTFRELCDLSMPDPDTLDGISLHELLRNGHALPERTLFWRHGGDKAARRGPWKLLTDNDGSRLYNLSEDIGEACDRMSDKPNTAKRLARELREWESGLPPSL